MAGVPRSLEGSLLISAPHLWDPNFRRTVVFIIEHNADGAMGLVINNPTDMDARGILPEWDRFIVEPPVVFLGGPVAVESAIGLARMTSGHGEVGLVDLATEPEGVAALRVFAGYSGWGAGQLEDEMGESAWLIVRPEVDDVLDPDPRGLWERVVNRLPDSMRVLRTMPHDPGLN